MKGFERKGLVVLFSVKLGSVPSAGFAVGGARRCLLLGLARARAHDVLLDGVRLATPTASPAGSLEIEVPGAGRVEVIRR